MGTEGTPEERRGDLVEKNQDQDQDRDEDQDQDLETVSHVVMGVGGRGLEVSLVVIEGGGGADHHRP